MRVISLLSIVLVASAAACGGATGSEISGGAGTGGPGAEPGKPGASGTEAPGSEPGVPAKRGGAGGVAGAECATPTNVLVASGGTIARPDGSALRLQLVYQGASIGVTNIVGVDKLLSPGGGPFTAGGTSGYWVEARSGTHATYQHLFRDPTNLEAPAGPGGQGFSNSTIDRCMPKSISADVPNSTLLTEIVIYGSPYGTQDVAIELARFAVK